MSIELSQPRTFALEDRGRKYTLTVKPISAPMWKKYFAGIVSTQENVNGDLSSSFDSSGARLELLESALIDATGYGELPDGWQGKLPIRHRTAAGDLLTDVSLDTSAADDPDFIPALGSEVVVLKATWTANEAGRMQQVTGLRHTFNSPTAEHQKRYSRAMSRSIIVGGSRTGKTRWLGAQDVLMEIYDELIASVDGYTFNGDPLTKDGAAQLTFMDGYHKVAAATALFTPIDVAEEEKLAA